VIDHLPQGTTGPLWNSKQAYYQCRKKTSLQFRSRIKERKTSAIPYSITTNTNMASEMGTIKETFLPLEEKT
jgi:hypothetical protein